MPVSDEFKAELEGLLKWIDQQIAEMTARDYRLSSQEAVYLERLRNSRIVFEKALSRSP